MESCKPTRAQYHWDMLPLESKSVQHPVSQQVLEKYESNIYVLPVIIVKANLYRARQTWLFAIFDIQHIK